MRVAIISDIHGNFEALRAVLSDIKRRRVERIVCLGDVAATGPQPKEVIELLQRGGYPCVSGNTDEALADNRPDEFPKRIPKDERKILQKLDSWTRTQLTKSHRQYLSTLKARIEIPLSPSRSLLCYHGSPSSNHDGIFPDMSDEELALRLEGHKATVFAGGHTHAQMCRRYLGSYVVNPGSVGLPFEKLPSGKILNPTKAEYAVLDFSEGTLGVELLSVRYPLQALRRAVQESDMPDPDWWLSDWR